MILADNLAECFDRDVINLFRTRAFSILFAVPVKSVGFRPVTYPVYMLLCRAISVRFNATSDTYAEKVEC